MTSSHVNLLLSPGYTHFSFLLVLTAHFFFPGRTIQVIKTTKATKVAAVMTQWAIECETASMGLPFLSKKGGANTGAGTVLVDDWLIIK